MSEAFFMRNKFKFHSHFYIPRVIVNKFIEFTDYSKYNYASLHIGKYHFEMCLLRDTRVSWQSVCHHWYGLSSTILSKWKQGRNKTTKAELLIRSILRIYKYTPANYKTSFTSAPVSISRLHFSENTPNFVLQKSLYHKDRMNANYISSLCRFLSINHYTKWSQKFRRAGSSYIRTTLSRNSSKQRKNTLLSFLHFAFAVSLQYNLVESCWTIPYLLSFAENSDRNY